MAYALGRTITYRDQPTVRAIAANAGENGYRMSSFIQGVVLSDEFRMKQKPMETDETDRPMNEEH
jgi:hypothetical protein